jgi:hypothetical protein
VSFFWATLFIVVLLTASILVIYFIVDEIVEQHPLEHISNTRFEFAQAAEQARRLYLINANLWPASDE